MADIKRGPPPRSKMTPLLLRTWKTVSGISAPRWNIVTEVPAGHQHFQPTAGIILFPIKFIPLYFLSSPMAQRPLVGQGFHIIEDSRLHSGTPHSVELLCMSDQLVADNFT